MTPLRTAAVLAHLDTKLDGIPHRGTWDTRGVAIEVYDQAHGLRLANQLNDITFGRRTGARILTVWAGTVTGVPVEIIHMDVTGRAA